MIMCQNWQGFHSAVNSFSTDLGEPSKAGIVQLGAWRILLNMNIVEACSGLLYMVRNQMSIATGLAAAFMLWGGVVSSSAAAGSLVVEPEADSSNAAVIRIADDAGNGAEAEV